MADQWYVRKGNGSVTGPFTSPQLKRMADEGKIDDHTPVSKTESGPFTLAGNVKGLTPPMATPTGPLPKFEGESMMDSVEMLREEPVDDETKGKKRRRSEPGDELRDPSYLALWSLAISAGMIVAMLIYGIAWKFSGPVWGYGAFLVPMAVTLFIVGSFPSLTRRTALNRLAVYITGLFLALSLIASLAMIWNMWTLDSRFKNTQDSIRRTFEKADRDIE